MIWNRDLKHYRARILPPVWLEILTAITALIAFALIALMLFMLETFL